MRAMVLQTAGTPLQLRESVAPEPETGQVRLAVRSCAVCRTDLHVVDGDLPNPKLPLVLGHEIVGTVDSLGGGVDRFAVGDRVGVPWLGWTCGACRFCRTRRENLCDRAKFTGYTLDGGYAEAALADARFCFRIPEHYDDARAAPLLCAGLIGYRTLRMAGDAERVGIYGFGAAAHILAQVALHQGRVLYAFTRPGDTVTQRFAQELGCAWAGDSTERPPDALDAALIFAPVGALVPLALKAVRKGGTVVSGGIHMSDIPSFPYADLWSERVVRSVANLTREDGEAFFEAADRIPIEVSVETFVLEDANAALHALRAGQLRGAAVLIPSEGDSCF